MLDATQIIQAHRAAAGPWSLHAITDSGLIPIVSGDDETCLDEIPIHHAALTGPARGGVVIRSEPDLHAVIVEPGSTRIFALTPTLPNWDDFGEIQLIWRLSLNTPIPDNQELACRIYLWQALRRRSDSPIQESARAAIEGDLAALAHYAGFPPLHRAGTRALGAAATLMQWDGQEPDEEEPAGPSESLRQKVARITPPRWALAEIIRKEGYPELAAEFMSPLDR